MSLDSRNSLRIKQGDPKSKSRVGGFGAGSRPKCLTVAGGGAPGRQVMEQDSPLFPNMVWLGR
jgi:hypothetical protein